MKNYIYIIFTFLLFAQMANGQARYFNERYTYTHYNLYPVLINPGATGASGNSQVVFNYRNKWAAFPNSPKTLTFSYDGDIGNRLGFGGLLLSDSFGELETTKGQVSFSYSIESPTNKVGFGLSTEFVQHRVAGSSISNPFIDAVDPLLLSRLDGVSFFDASFGIHGMYADKITYGLVLPGLISSRLNDTFGDGGESEFDFILNFGYIFRPENNDIVVEPSIYIKQLMFVPLHVDVNLKVSFLEEKLTGGFTYSIGADERLGFLIGTKVNSFRFYYGYNVSRHDFQQFNNGSHELTVGFDIGSFSKEEIPQN